MADPEQLEILERGAEAWNRWREENRKIKIDLRWADLPGADLRGANLSEADLDGVVLREASLCESDLSYAVLSGAHLNGADLSNADLHGANFRVAHLAGSILRGADLFAAHLVGADLQGADLGRANLWGADLRGAILCEANLSNATLDLSNLRNATFDLANLHEADLPHADLSGANLVHADLTGANLMGTDLTEANLSEANLKTARLGQTILPANDLSDTIGLEEVVHLVPSLLGIDTMQRSRGRIPEVFLRGCGLSDWEIESAKLYNPDLSNWMVDKVLYKIHGFRARQRLQVSPLLIAYSHADYEFVDKLEERLNQKGVRFWRDVHDAAAGKLPDHIHDALHLKPGVLLILSQDSVGCEWVPDMVHKARDVEKKTGRHVLYPVILDASWRASPWPASVLEQLRQYSIPDLSGWKHDGKSEEMFEKLISSLDLYSRKV